MPDLTSNDLNKTQNPNPDDRQTVTKPETVTVNNPPLDGEGNERDVEKGVNVNDDAKQDETDAVTSDPELADKTIDGDLTNTNIANQGGASAGSSVKIDEALNDDSVAADLANNQTRVEDPNTGNQIPGAGLSLDGTDPTATGGDIVETHIPGEASDQNPLGVSPKSMKLGSSAPTVLDGTSEGTVATQTRIDPDSGETTTTRVDLVTGEELAPNKYPHTDAQPYVAPSKEGFELRFRQWFTNVWHHLSAEEQIAVEKLKKELHAERDSILGDSTTAELDQAGKEQLKELEVRAAEEATRLKAKYF